MSVDIPPEPIPEETSPPATPETPENIEEVAEQVEELEYTLNDMCADILARIDLLDERVQDLHERFNGYATSTHEHSTTEPTTTTNGAGAPPERETDERPASSHFYFRRLGE